MSQSETSYKPTIPNLSFKAEQVSKFMICFNRKFDIKLDMLFNVFLQLVDMMPIPQFFEKGIKKLNSTIDKMSYYQIQLVKGNIKIK